MKIAEKNTSNRLDIKSSLLDVFDLYYILPFGKRQ